MAKYKINEAAHILGVDRVILYDKLISFSNDFKPYVTKVGGITYLEEDGLNVMKNLLTNTHETHDQGQPKWRFNHGEIEHRVRMFKGNDDLQGSQSTPRMESSPTNQQESSDEIIVEFNDKIAEINALKSSIVEKRNELIQLDGDIKRRSDAINSYHALMTEDIEWLWSMEEKIVNHIEMNGVGEDKSTARDSIFNFISR